MRAASGASRLRPLLLLGLAALLALGSFWALQVVRKGGDAQSPAAAREEPDYYVENFDFVRLSSVGEARYNLSGKRLTHYPADDSHLVEAPVVHNLTNQQAPVTGTAERAIVDNQNNKIHLYDNVHIDRPATPENEHFHLTSEYLLLLPDEDIMQTDQPALITLGASRLRGNSLFVDNAARTMHLSGDVHATYQPSPSSGPPRPGR